jgi:hypothetical protein
MFQEIVEFLEGAEQSMSLAREYENTINSVEAVEGEILEEREEPEELERMPQLLSYSSGARIVIPITLGAQNSSVIERGDDIKSIKQVVARQLPRSSEAKVQVSGLIYLYVFNLKELYSLWLYG